MKASVNRKNPTGEAEFVLTKPRSIGTIGTPMSPSEAPSSRVL